VDDPARRRRHGARARERARTAFSLDAMLSAYAAVYAAATG
jgi:glycosyltransferase involved in cell wall biosynthesis